MCVCVHVCVCACAMCLHALTFVSVCIRTHVVAHVVAAALCICCHAILLWTQRLTPHMAKKKLCKLHSLPTIYRHAGQSYLDPELLCSGELCDP